MMQYLKYGMTALGGILIALTIYGAHQFYFNKPVPIVNNNTVQPGATVNVKQGTDGLKGHLYTGLSGNRDTIMVEVGWVW